MRAGRPAMRVVDMLDLHPSFPTHCPSTPPLAGAAYPGGRIRPPRRARGVCAAQRWGLLPSAAPPARGGRLFPARAGGEDPGAGAGAQVRACAWGRVGGWGGCGGGLRGMRRQARGTWRALLLTPVPCKQPRARVQRDCQHAALPGRGEVAAGRAAQRCGAGPARAGGHGAAVGRRVAAGALRADRVPCCRADDAPHACPYTPALPPPRRCAGASAWQSGCWRWGRQSKWRPCCERCWAMWRRTRQDGSVICRIQAAWGGGMRLWLARRATLGARPSVPPCATRPGDGGL